MPEESNPLSEPSKEIAPVRRPCILPLTQMARILGVTSKWLRAEAEAGRLPHVPADKTILFDADLIEQLLAERARRLPTPDETTLATVSEDNLDLLHLSVRARKGLRRETEFCSPILTINQLCTLTAEDILNRKNMGYTSLTEIRNKLALRGLKLKGD